MKYSIVYSSKTGNTKMLGEAIKEKLGNDNIGYCGSPSIEALDSDIIYVGFWTDKGEPNAEIIDFLKIIKNKKVFLFGTAGFGVSKEYFDKIIERAIKHLDSSVEVIGSFMCQGKMPLSVRDRYVMMKEKKMNIPNIDMLIDNFDKALAHPDSSDIESLLKLI